MNHLARFSLALAATAGALACGDSDPIAQTSGAPMRAEAPAEVAVDTPNRAPEIRRVWLDPASPQPGEEIHARVEASDPDGDGMTFTYQWSVNGRQVAGAQAMHVDSMPKGSQIEVRVIPNDGETDGAVATASASVGNQPPVLLGIVIEPLGDVTVENDIIASPRANDVDGDRLDYQYQWWVNDRPLNDYDNTLDTARFKRGDRIMLRVVASDGDADSEPLKSKEFKVANAIPRITSTPGGFDTEGTFAYNVTVEDADGDRRFRYSLSQAPKGMTIDKRKGSISWSPSEADEGQHSVVVEADDMAGGIAKQTFQVNVGFEAPATPAAQAQP